MRNFLAQRIIVEPTARAVEINFDIRFHDDPQPQLMRKS